MNTTIDSLTEAQITRLEEQAAEAGDLWMAAICRVARLGKQTRADLADVALTSDQLSAVLGMRQDHARKAVVRAVNDAEAQHDEAPDSERTQRADHDLDEEKDRRVRGEG
jgi:hypothetical protein